MKVSQKRRFNLHFPGPICYQLKNVKNMLGQRHKRIWGLAFEYIYDSKSSFICLLSWAMEIAPFFFSCFAVGVNLLLWPSDTMLKLNWMIGV